MPESKTEVGRREVVDTIAAVPQPAARQCTKTSEAKMAFDWQRLRPHRPLGVNDPLHAPRPHLGAESLAARMADPAFRTFAIAGPVGSGKSTEIAYAAGLLASEFVNCLVPLDRHHNMRRLRVGVALEAIARRVAEIAVDVLSLRLSDDLTDALGRKRAFATTDDDGDAEDLLRLTVTEVAGRSHQGRVALLVDGLEKAPADVVGEVASSLTQLPEEVVVVVVVPPSAVIGPQSFDLNTEYTYFPLRAVPVDPERDGQHGERGQAFLREIAMRRWGTHSLSEPLEELVRHAASLSGGVPRVHLQLLHDSKAYARLAGRSLPSPDDVEAAATDQGETLKRLLRDGDLKWLRDTAGVDTLEIPIERRQRFLVHGLLLESDVGERTGAVVAPVLKLVGIGG